MKNIHFLLALMIASFITTSCSHAIPITTESPKNNQTYEVDFLFEYEGCKVYRFYDRGHSVYFTNCKGDLTAFVNDSTIIRNNTTLIPFKK